MKDHINILKKTRTNILNVINSLSIEELNYIPDGFKNHITWNVAHTIVTQELLIYGLSEEPLYYEKPFIIQYRKGEFPKDNIDKKTIILLKKELLESVNRFENDLAKSVFNEFKTYETSYGITLNSIKEAIIFNNIHEALHFGYILAKRKLIPN